MIKLVYDLYYRNLHYIKVFDEELDKYEIIIMRCVVLENDTFDWEWITTVPCDKNADLDRVGKQLWMLYHDAHPLPLPDRH